MSYVERTRARVLETQPQMLTLLLSGSEVSGRHSPSLCVLSSPVHADVNEMMPDDAGGFLTCVSSLPGLWPPLKKSSIIPICRLLT